MRELNLTEQVRQSVTTQLWRALSSGINTQVKRERWKTGQKGSRNNKTKVDGAFKSKGSTKTVIINQQEIFSTSTGGKEQVKVNFNWAEIKDGS